jgi:hypothetical protein
MVHLQTLEPLIPRMAALEPTSPPPEINSSPWIHGTARDTVWPCSVWAYRCSHHHWRPIGTELLPAVIPAARHLGPATGMIALDTSSADPP